VVDRSLLGAVEIHHGGTRRLHDAPEGFRPWQRAAVLVPTEGGYGLPRYLGELAHGHAGLPTQLRERQADDLRLLGVSLSSWPLRWPAVHASRSSIASTRALTRSASLPAKCASA